VQRPSARREKLSRRDRARNASLLHVQTKERRYIQLPVSNLRLGAPSGSSVASPRNSICPRGGSILSPFQTELALRVQPVQLTGHCCSSPSTLSMCCALCRGCSSSRCNLLICCSRFRRDACNPSLRRRRRDQAAESATDVEGSFFWRGFNCWREGALVTRSTYCQGHF